VIVEYIDVHSGMEIVERDECLALLAGEEVGRMGVVIGGWPEIFPVNYVLDGDGVMFRTDAGSKLAGATGGPVVFEVDHVDRATKSAWSVILHGRADQVTVFHSPELRRRMSQVSLYPWTRTAKPYLVRITPRLMTGRRIRRRPDVGDRLGKGGLMPPNERLPDAHDDDGGLDELDENECWRLLATQQVGRIAVVVGHYPMVFPVNYTLDGETIMFRTGPGTKLHAIQSSNVTFEVDEIDVVHRGGWSVLVRGTASEIGPGQNPPLADVVQAAGASPWAPGERSHLVRIVSYQITGRRIRPEELLPERFDGRRYL
jgi:uncharacterized protein